MKKFVGLVNGKSFDNEKDWTKAAQEALKENDGNLYISSYYNYSCDNAQKEEEKVDESKYVSTNEYFLGDRKADKVDLIQSMKVGQPGYTNREYTVSPELAEKLKVAVNKENIEDSINFHVKKLISNIKEYREEINDIEKQIEELQKELHEQTDLLLDQEARRKYYNTLLDIIETSEIESEEDEDTCAGKEVKECEETCEKKCEDKKEYEEPKVKVEKIKNILGFKPGDSLLDILKQLGLL